MIFRRKFVVTSKNDDDDGRHRRFNLLDLKSLPYTEVNLEIIGEREVRSDKMRHREGRLRD